MVNSQINLIPNVQLFGLTCKNLKIFIIIYMFSVCLWSMSLRSTVPKFNWHLAFSSQISSDHSHPTMHTTTAREPKKSNKRRLKLRCLRRLLRLNISLHSCHCQFVITKKKKINK